MKTHWETQNGFKNHYIDIRDKNLYIWENYEGDAHTEMGGMCSFEEFISGKFHTIIQSVFGPHILDEILDMVKILNSQR